MKKEKTIKKIIAIMSVILLLILTFLVGKIILLELNDPTVFKEKLDNYGAFGYIIFTFIAFIQVILALIPSEGVEIAGGYAYGVILGTTLVLIGVTLGSALVIILTKKYGKKFVNLFYDEKDISNIKLFKDEKKLSKLLFILYLIPGVPKDIITYVVGLSDLKLSTYLIVATIARIPNIVISALAGNSLRNHNMNDFVIYILLSVISGVIGYLIYKFYISKKEDL